jgi:hypothetical protein
MADKVCFGVWPKHGYSIKNCIDNGTAKFLTKPDKLKKAGFRLI